MSLSLDTSATLPATSAYLPYTSAVEQPAPNEAVIFDELSRTMQHITRTVASRYRHAYRPVHANRTACSPAPSPSPPSPSISPRASSPSPPAIPS